MSRLAAIAGSAVPTSAVDCLNVNAIAQCGSYVTNGSYDGPAGYYSPEPTPGVSSPQPLYNHSIQGDLEGYVTIPYYWFVGTVTITLDNYAPGQQQHPTNNCPSTLAAGAYCTLSVAFAPQAATGYAATVFVTEATLFSHMAFSSAFSSIW